jgi:hypothetical protein
MTTSALLRAGVEYRSLYLNGTTIELLEGALQ